MEVAILICLHLLIVLIIVRMVFLVSIHTEMVIFFQVHSSHCFHFYSTVLSYYEQKQKEQSDGVCKTG